MQQIIIGQVQERIHCTSSPSRSIYKLNPLLSPPNLKHKLHKPFVNSLLLLGKNTRPVPVDKLLITQKDAPRDKRSEFRQQIAPD